MNEEEVKQTIKDSKIADLKQLAIMLFKKEVERFDVMEAFKNQTKEILEQQIIAWEEMLEDMIIQCDVSKEISSGLTEENQNEIIAEDITNKECKYMFYKTELSIDYYLVCIGLMKKILKNK